MTRSICSLLAIAALASMPSAALATPITSGTATLDILTPVFSSTNGDVALRFSGSPAIPDQQERLTWYYRTPADSANHIFSFVDTPSATFSGNTATITYSNAGPGTSGTARFNAQFVFTLTSTAPGMAQVNTALTFTSAANNTATQTFNLFNVIGFGLGANTAADTYHVNNNTGISGTATDTGSSGYFVNFENPGASRYEFNTGSALNGKLTSGGQNLATGAGSTASDFSHVSGAAGFQYTLTLAPGQSATINTVYALNQAIAPIPEPSTWALVGIGALGLLANQRRRLSGLLKR